ncbi:5-carboxymethyl-2-hydroxymuconate Delta-isomerase [Thaumasiovibrio sp. DFM-14]|uniref:5-carboxymethyl-2-hydroxymuconate Delta-isomerase n=1 Tax=Thaumasiovibrio sp. DFM-14 TaxID=3384792 RepID=UPI0039A0ED39
MPNLVMEYSESVAEQVNIAALLDDLHQVCLQSALFEDDAIKSRCYPCHHWQIGRREDSCDFIHVDFALLSGRDEQSKQRLAEQFLGVLRHHAGAVFSLTIEMRDMDKATFTKALQA